MNKNLLLFLVSAALLVSAASCAGDEEMPYSATKSPKINWKVNVRAHSDHESINADGQDKEDLVTNVVLAGAPHTADLSTHVYDGSAGSTNTAVFPVENFLGKKDFFFAANLKPEDAARVGISGVETDFNRLELNTADYMRNPMKFFADDPDHRPIPMAAALRDVEAPTNAASGLTALSQNDVRLERCFAKIEIYPECDSGVVGRMNFPTGYARPYHFRKTPFRLSGLPNISSESGDKDHVELQGIAPYNFSITRIRLCNVPAKFSLGGPIADYDLKHKANPEQYPYLEPIDIPLVYMELDGSMNATTTYEPVTVYLPEHFVSHPEFHSADLKSMTYLEISYTSRWIDEEELFSVDSRLLEGLPEPTVNGKCYYRIGDAEVGHSDKQAEKSSFYGQIHRNTVYKCKFKIGEKFDITNPTYRRLNEKVIN